MSEDYASQLYGQVKKQQVADDYASQLYSRGVTLGTQETQTGRAPIPGVVQPSQVEPGGGGFLANLKAEFVRNPETAKRIFAQELFNDPEQASRIGQMDDGSFVADMGNGRYRVLDEGFMSGLGRFVGQTPEIVGGVVGSLATGNPLTGSVVGEVGGRALKQIIGAIAFDEPQTTEENLKDLAIQGGIAAVPATLMGGGIALRDRAALRGADKFDLKAAQALRERVRTQTGIDLDLAQASDFRQFRDLKKWAAKFPSESAEIIEELGRVQQGQAQEAVRGILDKLSPQADRQALAASGVKAAKSVLDAAKLQRKVVTRPLYEVVDSMRLPTNVQATLKADEVFGSEYNAVISDPIFKKELKGGENTIKAWDLVVRRLDDRINAAQKAGNSNEARLLQDNRDELVQNLTTVSPEYAAARQAWAKASDELVNPLENSSLGVIAGLEEKGLKTTELVAKAANNILEDPRITSSAKAMVERVDPQAWRNLVRLSLQDSFERASKETASGDVANFAGKFRQRVIGTPARRQAMEAAVGKSVDDMFDMTMDAFQRIARDKSLAGSDTAFNQLITDQMRDRSRGAVVGAIRSAAAPLQTIRELGEQRFLEQNAVKIAEALTDPTKAAKLREIRKVTDKTRRDLAILGIIFGDTVESQ